MRKFSNKIRLLCINLINLTVTYKHLIFSHWLNKLILIMNFIMGYLWHDDPIRNLIIRNIDNLIHAIYISWLNTKFKTLFIIHLCEKDQYLLVNIKHKLLFKTQFSSKKHFRYKSIYADRNKLYFAFIDTFTSNASCRTRFSDSHGFLWYVSTV